MKLSIIICVYNTPKSYLGECLESITSSTVKSLGSDYEICMVDDGSTEDYSELVKYYGVRVKKTENRGIYSARRTGAEMALGDYSIYCDSDDTVSFNYYLPMLLEAEKLGADVVINDWATQTHRARYYAKNDETICSDIDIGNDDTLFYFVKNEGRQHSFFVLWNKLYRTELLRSSFATLDSFGFNERSSYSEDAALNFFIWKSALRVVNLHTGYYFYRIHQNQTVVAANEEKLRRQIDSMAQTFEIMRKGIGENQRKEQILHCIDEWAALMSRAHYSLAKASGYTELFDYIREKYGTKNLSLSTARDGSCYENKALLGDNFKEVDSALLSVYDSEKPTRCAYSKKDKYTARSVEYLRGINKVTNDKTKSEVIIPHFVISFKQRLLHNAILYRIGLILFKKGSRMRNFLKKFL